MLVMLNHFSVLQRVLTAAPILHPPAFAMMDEVGRDLGTSSSEWSRPSWSVLSVEPNTHAASGRIGWSACEEERLREIVVGNFDFIWRSLRRLGVLGTDVDDCVQQVFWVAARKLERIELGCERAFLFSTAVRVASDARRSRTRKREVSDDVLVPAVDHHPSPEQLADRKRAREVLDEVLDAMPLDLRVVFMLVELEELSAPEIADLLEIPIGTVASRLRRARHEFHRAVSRLRAREAFAWGGVGA